jgi:hypothetical protein
MQTQITKRETRMRKEGERRIVVEWCKEIPLDEFGDRDIDRAKYVKTEFGSLRKATEFARSLIRDRRDAFGCVRIEEQTLTVDHDALEHEGMRVLTWRCDRAWDVDDENGPRTPAQI